jgi:hypothetical protein
MKSQCRDALRDGQQQQLQEEGDMYARAIVARADQLMEEN